MRSSISTRRWCRGFGLWWKRSKLHRKESEIRFMTFPKARLAVSACLLVAWLGYLGFLVYETRDVVVLSRPQFMVAQVYAVVNVRDQQGRADSDVEVVWASSAN